MAVLQMGREGSWSHHICSQEPEWTGSHAWLGDLGACLCGSFLTVKLHLPFPQPCRTAPLLGPTVQTHQPVRGISMQVNPGVRTQTGGSERERVARGWLEVPFGGGWWKCLKLNSSVYMTIPNLLNVTDCLLEKA